MKSRKLHNFLLKIKQMPKTQIFKHGWLKLKGNLTSGNTALVIYMLKLGFCGQA